MFWFVAFCLFLAQLVSGNIGDARQMYVFALLAIFRGEAFTGGSTANTAVQNPTVQQIR